MNHNKEIQVFSTVRVTLTYGITTNETFGK